MRNKENGVAIKCAEFHEVFGVEFGIAAFSVDTATKEQYGIGFAFFDEICRIIATFKICGLSVEYSNPFDMVDFIILDKPVTALFKNGVCEDCNNK